MIRRDLLDKYDKAMPRYTSYPPANFFNEDFTEADYKTHLVSSNREKPENISLYIHIPFCPRLCFYCGCNTTITRNDKVIEAYMDALKKEINKVATFIDNKREVSQIHWGGGTPNALGIDVIKPVMDLIYERFRIREKAEIAMECSPAYLSYDYLDALFDMGFNRISLGIQDFRTEVLKAVNRAEPALPVEIIMDYIRKNSGAGVNLDFIYGLPLQTVESFKETIGRAAALHPDRLVTFSYAHVPWFRKAQKKLESYGLPDAGSKLEMFEAGYDVMTSKGYTPIGLDHYAKPDDELSKALANKQLHRNFQGYCTRETTGQVYAFGTSAISQLHSAYAQNTKDVAEYTKSIKDNRFVINKGYKLKLDQIVIREVVNEIMCNQRLSWEVLAERLLIDDDVARKMTRNNYAQLREFESDGLIRLHEDGLEVINDGRFFIRNIAASFDPMLKDEHMNYSRSV